MKLNQLLLSFILLIFFKTSSSQIHNNSLISKERLKTHITILSSDSFMGRSYTTPIRGDSLASAYIRKQIKDSNLKTICNNYYQSFKVITSNPSPNNSQIEIHSTTNKKKLTIHDFTNFYQYTEPFSFSGDLIFFGFGCHLNDINIRNKVVLFSAGSPTSYKQGHSYLWDSSQEIKKAKNFLNKGAVGVIIVSSIQDKKNTTYNRIKQWISHPISYINDKKNKTSPPIILITPTKAQLFFNKNKKWKNIISSAAHNKNFAPYTIRGKRVTIKADCQKNSFTTQNVIGYIEGKDPILKNEYIVFMAHYDHLGINNKQEIYNGADDNATGVSSLLELAHAFSIQSMNLKRSIVFLWTSGEEAGLLGSEYYIKNPIFPIKKTRACINLDMIGRVYESDDSVWAGSPKQVKKFNEIYVLTNNSQIKTITDSACNKLGLIPDYSLPDSYFCTSDHFHFYRHNIPILNLSTGYSADYHKVSDESDYICYDKVKKVTELCYRIGLKIANK